MSLAQTLKRGIWVYLLLAVTGVAIALAIIWHIGKSPNDYPKRPFIRSSPSIGDEENPHARSEWEWTRLHDPRTGRIPPNIRARELAFAAKVPRAHLQSGQTISWNSRGPFNVGGRTRALAIDISNESAILAGGVSGGMWRSTDAGITWTKTTSTFQIQSVSCIAQDPRPGKTHIWYYGTGELWGNSAGYVGGGSGAYPGNGIFKSTNGGVSWSQLSSTLTGGFEYVIRIAIDPSNLSQDELYAATANDLFRSTDGGLTWQSTRINTNQQTYYDVVVTSTGTVYTVDSFSPQHIWRSADGLTWTDITPAGFFPTWTNRVVLAIAPSNENVTYTLSARGYQPQENDLWKYTYVSGDGSGSGGVWENRTGNVPSSFFTQLAYAHVIAVKPDDENAVFIGDVRLFRSTDGYATNSNTTEIASTLSLYGNGDWADHHALAFLPSNAGVMLSASDGGVYRTSNNLAPQVVFNSLNNGYVTSQFYTVAIDHSTAGNNIVLGGMQDAGIWFTNTDTSRVPWIPIAIGDGGSAAISSGRRYYYLSLQNGVIYRAAISDNGTLLPGQARINPTAPPGGYQFIHPFVLDKNNTNIMYLPKGDRIWRNSDLSAIPDSDIDTTTSINWTELTNTAIGDGFLISALGTSEYPPNRLYYGNQFGKVFRLDSANVGNPVPVDIWSSRGLPQATVSSIAIDPLDADKVLLVFSNYGVNSLYYTTDAGATWAPVPGNLEQNPDGSGDGPSCRWAAILPGNGTTYYFVGSSTGLYSTSSLSGMSTVWGQEGASTIGNAVVDMIDARRSDGLVVVGTHGNGVFSAKVSIATSSIAHLKITALLQGYYQSAVDTTRVDTITVELRNKSTPSAGVDTAKVVTDKFGKVTFSFSKSLASADSFYVVVKHRNHLGVISSVPYRFAPNETTFVNLTDSLSKVQGSEAMWAESNGKFSLRGGDANGDGRVNAVDRNSYWRVENGTSGANLPADFNGDGAVNAIDRNAIWRPNNGRASYVP